MTNPRIFIFFSAMFLLTRCNNNELGDTASGNLVPIDKIQSGNSITGTWKYTYSIWYTSELMLEENGSFTFHDQGCTIQRFSKGLWTNTNGIIELTSFDSFKSNEDTATKKFTQSTELKETKRKWKKEKTEFIFIDTSKKTVFFRGPNDTTRVYFAKILLQLKGDTLFCISNNKLPEEATFYKEKTAAMP